MNKYRVVKGKKQSRRFKRVKPITFWLKFAKAAPDIAEENLKPRVWAISKEELG